MLPFSSTNLPASHIALLEHYEAGLHAAYAAGTYEPIILPYHWYGFLFVVVYLLCEPSRSRILYYYRYISFAIFVAWSIWCVRRVRSPTPHTTYGIGLLNAWAVIWLAALMIFTDIKDHRRIWATRDAPREQRELAKGSATNGAAKETSVSASGAQIQDNAEKQARQRVQQPQTSENDTHGELIYQYYWQPCPRQFPHRVNWLFDLTTSMRAPGWQHQMRSIPTPPQDVMEGLPKPHVTARPTVRNYRSRWWLIGHSILIAAYTYLSMDVLKNIAMRDPYFWGFMEASPLPTHPLAQLQNPILLRAYRLIMSLTMIGLSLLAIFNLNALAFAGVCGPDLFPYLRIRAAPWSYPNWYGSFWNVAEDGITGWWGSFWHQIFRLGFSAPGIWLCEKMKWNPRGQKAKMAGVLIAFSLSGILHAAGSYTTFPETNPMMGSFLFFFLQGLGIIFESVVKGQLKKLGVQKRLPWPIKNALVLCWIAVWMLATGPFIADDFARSGVWLLEPVPFSVVRLLGYGIEGQGVLAWRGRLLWWHQGKRWWQSGIAF